MSTNLSKGSSTLFPSAHFYALFAVLVRSSEDAGARCELRWDVWHQRRIGKMYVGRFTAIGL